MADDPAFQEQKRALVPYLDRAQEIETINPKIAYYCRLYALEQAVKLGQKNLHPMINTVILAVSDNLAKARPTLDLNRHTDGAECEQWAALVFARADKNDRTGNHAVARNTFVYASQFFDVASQLGELSPDGQRLQKYARWRAVVLGKALRAGTLPDPPPALEAGGMHADEESELFAALEELPSVPTAALASPHPLEKLASPPAPAPVPAPPPAAPAEAPPGVVPPAAAMPPSPPPPPLETSLPGSSDVSNAIPVRSFVPFQKVWVNPTGAATGQRELGTVGEVLTDRRGNTVYRVALKRSIVTVDGDVLAPVIDSGSTLVYFGEETHRPEEVSIEEVYGSEFPPKYLVRKKYGGTLIVDDEDLAFKPAPTAPVAPSSRVSDASPPAFAPSTTHQDASHAELPPLPAGAPESAAAAAAAAEGEGEGEAATAPQEPVDHLPPRGATPELPSIAEERSADLRSEPEEAAQAAAEEESTTATVEAFAPLFPPTDAVVSPPQAPIPPPVAAAPLPTAAPPLSANVASAPLASVQHHHAAPPHAPGAPSTFEQQQVHTPHAVPGYEPPLSALVEAQKLTKTAGSALSFEDVPTAIKHLTESLRLLTQPGAHKRKM
jgi:vacuolar protein sorting-associated protein VTA1